MLYDGVMIYVAKHPTRGWKIGTSTQADVSAYVRSQYRADVIWLGEGNYLTENRIHVALADKQTSGEWFDLTGIDIDKMMRDFIPLPLVDEPAWDFIARLQ